MEVAVGVGGRRVGVGVVSKGVGEAVAVGCGVRVGVEVSIKGSIVVVKVGTRVGV
jgi:hypothetical protein